MKKFLVLGFLLLSSVSQAAPSPLVTQARRFLEVKDYLGFRIYVKKLYPQKINLGEWFAVKNLIVGAADHSGFDLIPFWNARNKKGASDLDRQLFTVDALLQAKQYDQAFDLAQDAAQKVKALHKTRYDAKAQLPYIFHSMGRALYGAGRYNDALKVYLWIGPSYPYFVQVLFERMWAAFKAGRVELALGAIASQRSAYFNKYLSPESYLVQSYLYRRLCREEDQKQVIAEMQEYEAALASPNSNIPPFTDISTLTLWRLANAPTLPTDLTRPIPLKERQVEQNFLKTSLLDLMNSRKARLLKDIRNVIAYQALSNEDDSKNVLLPVEKMKDRDDLLKLNLEIWPADSAEEWIDEVGKHVLIGESRCKQQK